MFFLDSCSLNCTFLGYVGFHGGVFWWLFQCACRPILFLSGNLLQRRMDHCARYSKLCFPIETNYNLHYLHFVLAYSIPKQPLVWDVYVAFRLLRVPLHCNNIWPLRSFNWNSTLKTCLVFWFVSWPSGCVAWLEVFRLMSSRGRRRI